MAPSKNRKNISGATVLVSFPPSRLTMATSCWPSSPSPESENDVTDYRPLSLQTVAVLGFFPPHVAADAAFDAWYIYENYVRHGGIAAIPLNQHGHPRYERDGDGVPLCPKGLRMYPTYQFAHTRGYRAQRYRCSLLFPQSTGQICTHEQ